VQVNVAVSSHRRQMRDILRPTIHVVTDMWYGVSRAGRVRDAVHVRRTPYAMRLMSSGVVCVMRSTVSAREAKKRHRRHAGGAKNDTKKV
jgi:hypothetical protein